MKVAWWWVLAGLGGVLASMSNPFRDSSSSSDGEDEGENGLPPTVAVNANVPNIEVDDLDDYFSNLANQMQQNENAAHPRTSSSTSSTSSSDSSTDSIEVDNDIQYNPDDSEEDAWGDDDGEGPMPRPPPGLMRLIPQFFSGEVLLNNLLDNHCDLDQLVRLLHTCLQREEFGVFETACAACLQQYDPDDDRMLEILEMTIILDKPRYFEAILAGQCRSKMGAKVLEYLPTFTEHFIAPALRQCSAIIPRHAVDVWRGDYEMEKEDGTVDWTRVDGITVDLHTQLPWPYKNDGEYKERRITGLWAKYSGTGEGHISPLDQSQGQFFATKLGTGTSIFGVTNGEPISDIKAVLGAATVNILHNSINTQLYNSSNRFRAAVAMAIPSATGEFSLYVDRLTDGGPMILVYRSGELIYPTSLQTYSEDRKDLPIDTQIWGQPSPRLFLPIAVDATIPLIENDVILLVPDSLQLLTPEIDLRGLMYCADKEGLPEIVADFLKSLCTKTKKDVQLAAAIVI